MANQTATEKILEIKVKYDDAISAIAEYRTEMDKLKQHEKELRDELKKAQKDENLSAKERADALAKYNIEMEKTKAEYAQYSDAVRTLTKHMQNERKQQTENEGSLKALRAELSNLTADYDSLSREARNGEEGQKLQEQINAITNELKGAEEETQRFYRNVGNYKNAIIEAADANIPFVDEIHKAVTAMGGLREYLSGLSGELGEIVSSFKAAQASTAGMTVAQAALTTSLNVSSAALKVFRLALISTGIGAIVVALGSLISYLSQTQAGIELANKVMGALGATVNVLIDRASKLGSALVNLFTGNFSKAADDAKEAFTGIGKEIAEESKQAWALADALNEIDKREVMLSMSMAANRAEIEKLKKAADDTTLSTKERIKAAEQAAKMEQDDLKLQERLAEARLANTLGYTEMNGEVRKLIQSIKEGDITADEVIRKLGLSESTLEDLKTFRDQFNELQELQEDSYGRQTELQNTLNSIRQEGADAAKEAKEKELEEIRKAEDELLELVKDSREKQRKETELAYDREIEDLQNRLTTEKDLTAKAREAINTQITALEQQKQNALDKLSEEELKKEIENRQKIIELQLEVVKKGSEEEFKLQKEQLEAERDAELADTELTEEMRQAIIRKYQKLEDDLTKQHEIDKLESKKEFIELEQSIEKEGSDEMLKLTLDRLELEKKIELSNTELTEKEKLAIIKKYQDLQKDAIVKHGQDKETAIREQQQKEYESYEKAGASQYQLQALQAYQEIELLQKTNASAAKIDDAKFELANTLVSQTIEVTGKLGEENKAFAKLSKTLAIAQIAIETGRAIAAGVAQAAATPWPGNIAAIVSTIATIMANIATATSLVNSAKFAEGGLVTGPGSGTSDSIPARLSNGESVMTAAATSMFGPILSSFNQMGGGVPINVANAGSQAVGEEMLAKAVAKGMMMAPPPVVSVEEFTSVANRVKYVENLGSV